MFSLQGSGILSSTVMRGMVFRREVEGTREGGGELTVIVVRLEVPVMISPAL